MGDRYYIKLLKDKKNSIWEGFVDVKEECTSSLPDNIFVDIMAGYLPKKEFDKAEKMKVYIEEPSIGDLILINKIDISNFTIWLNSNKKSDGIKYDKAKPLAGDVLQIFGKAIMGVGQCILKGAEKYPEIDNWKRVKNAEQRYTNALVRHLIKHLTGEEVDKESGLPHLQHVVWNALAVCELYLERKNNNG